MKRPEPIKTVNVKLPVRLIEEIAAVVHSNPRYRNQSHFIELAIIALLEQERNGEGS